MDISTRCLEQNELHKPFPSACKRPQKNWVGMVNIARKIFFFFLNCRRNHFIHFQLQNNALICLQIPPKVKLTLGKSFLLLWNTSFSPRKISPRGTPHRSDSSREIPTGVTDSSCEVPPPREWLIAPVKYPPREWLIAPVKYPKGVTDSSVMYPQIAFPASVPTLQAIWLLISYGLEHHTYSEGAPYLKKKNSFFSWKWQFFRAAVGKKVTKKKLFLFQITTFGCRRVH
jgi:hypothetical protein